MASYKIIFNKSVHKDLRPIPKKYVTNILEKILELKKNPRPHRAEKLTNDQKYRLRIGKYRVLYQIEDKIVTVTVVKIAHRKRVYK
jgi:mRNA interferase RelE/StbE